MIIKCQGKDLVFILENCTKVSNMVPCYTYKNAINNILYTLDKYLESNGNDRSCK